ncbi:vegetative cell wall protein gp1-like [Diospyros lotus]|uniref:vegetative cell wall protein gp1-like n=1 Tax=Diospyros lotus TaxID=55363 RepID=UPI002257EE53|nr:vegetative cell wall protein gp1-like [Diospyros lotus]
MGSTGMISIAMKLVLLFGLAVVMLTYPADARLLGKEDDNLGMAAAKLDNGEAKDVWPPFSFPFPTPQFPPFPFPTLQFPPFPFPTPQMPPFPFPTPIPPIPNIPGVPPLPPTQIPPIPNIPGVPPLPTFPPFHIPNVPTHA